MPRSFYFMVTALVLAMITVWPASANGAKVPQGAQAKVSKLESTVMKSVSYTKTPISEVVKQIRQATGVDIVFSQRIDVNQTISVDLTEPRAIDLLDLIVQEFRLTRQYRFGVVYLTDFNEPVLEPVFETRAHDISQIATDQEVSCEDIVDVIVRHIGSRCWEDSGHVITLLGTTVIVTSTEENHSSIDRLLTDLRKKK